MQPQTTADYHTLWLTAAYYQTPAHINADYHHLQQTTEYCQILPQTITDYSTPMYTTAHTTTSDNRRLLHTTLDYDRLQPTIATASYRRLSHATAHY